MKHIISLRVLITVMIFSTIILWFCSDIISAYAETDIIESPSRQDSEGARFPDEKTEVRVEQQKEKPLDCTDKLKLSGIFNFISLQEYNGSKNITHYWCSEEKTREDSNILYADKGSTIRIKFDKKTLYESDKQGESGFFTSGQISVSAHIDKRNVEIDGYSLIGQKVNEVGIEWMSASKFLSSIKLLQFKSFFLLNEFYYNNGLNP